MSQAKEPEEETIAKFFVFAMSVIGGVVIGSILGGPLGLPVPLCVIGGVVAALLYPLAAAAAASICEELHASAFPDTFRPWPTFKRALHGAFWPLTLLYWLVVAIFYSSINRLFPSTEDKPSTGEPSVPSPVPEKPALPQFVIEVVRRERAAHLRLADLAITHPGCGGGAFEPNSGDSKLTCKRCHVQFFMSPGEKSVGAICQTAFDGIRRVVAAYSLPTGYSEVAVQSLDQSSSTTGGGNS